MWQGLDDINAHVDDMFCCCAVKFLALEEHFNALLYDTIEKLSVKRLTGKHCY